MRNWKRLGTRLERKLRKKLEKSGFRVTRSSASLGMYDLVALQFTPSLGYIRLIQLKRSKIRSRERKAIASDRFSQQIVLSREIHLWRSKKVKIWRRHYIAQRIPQKA